MISAMDIRKVNAVDLVKRIRGNARQERNRSPRAMYTLLVGAGVSLGAGMPSTAMLVDAMKARRNALADGATVPEWSALLNDAATGTSDGSTPPGATAEYQMLFGDDELFPSPSHRQVFISEAILWAAGRQAPLSHASLLIASILLAGSGRSHPTPTPTDTATEDLSPWLAHTVYTTNFDEVLPQTFRYCGEPVIVVDHPGAHGRLHGDTRYPRIAYLHGCHLHYSLRNTAAELARPDTDRSGGIDLAGLFLRFRDVLRSTGLIVLGYSGWNDRAVRAIRDALADEESLPYGLYWGARFGDRSLSDTALQLLREHSDRACMLDEGKDAVDTLQTLCDGVGVPHRPDMARWASRLSVVTSQFASFSGPTTASPGTTSAPTMAPAIKLVTVPPESKSAANELRWEFEQSRLVQEAVNVGGALNRDAALAWVARARALVEAVRAGGGEVLPELLSHLGYVGGHIGDFESALRDLDAAYQKFSAAGSDRSAAAALRRKADCLTRLFRYDTGHAAAIEAAETFRRLGDWSYYLIATATAIRAATAQSRLAEALTMAQTAASREAEADPNARAWLNSEWAWALLRAGEESEAEETASRAMADWQAASVNLLGQSNALTLLGECALRRGDVTAAEDRYRRALNLREIMNEPVGKGSALLRLGRLALRNAKPAEAREDFERAEVLFQGVDRPDGFLEARFRLAEAAQAEGRPGDHVGAASDAARRLEDLPVTFTALQARLAQARIEARSGRKAAALKTARTVRDRARNLGEVLAERDAEATIREIEGSVTSP
jgi:tetratricopeptide (TPR) repeat protein